VGSIGFSPCENGVLAVYRNFKSEHKKKHDSFTNTTTHFVSRLDYPLLEGVLQALFEVPLYPVVHIRGCMKTGIVDSFTCCFDDSLPPDWSFNCCCDDLRVDPFGYDAYDDFYDDFYDE